jgi:hypothetical protein
MGNVGRMWAGAKPAITFNRWCVHRRLRAGAPIQVAVGVRSRSDCAVTVGFVGYAHAMKKNLALLAFVALITACAAEPTPTSAPTPTPEPVERIVASTDAATPNPVPIQAPVPTVAPPTVPTATPKPTPTPTPTITAKEKLISIGYNVPIVGSVHEAKQEYVASLDIPEQFRQRFIEVQENLNSVLGGYPNYIYVAYNRNGTEEDAKPVFERMAQLYPIDNNGKPFKDWTIAELINRQSCLGGADPGRGDPSTTNPYSVCLEDLDFIKAPFNSSGRQEPSYRPDIKMILHLGHEYFHHYQRVHALDRGLDYQEDRSNPETTVQAPTWWIEGAAVAFQNAWYKENWQSLSLLKDLTLEQALSTNIATVADSRVYKENRRNIMGFGDSEKCTPDWYMSSLDETYDTHTGCGATFMATAYLGYITSYKTVWIDIPQDYYDLGFWGSLEKHTGMSKQEFYDSYNEFLRTGDADDEPPDGWAPPENYISEHADFLKIVPESD